MPQPAKTLVILDCNALIHRSFHALPDFRTAKGELVNAVYGFTSILLKVLKEFEPEYVAASFDVAGPTFRDEEYEDYKATRVKAPDELYQQIPRVKEVLKAFHISVYEKEGFEADDVIGTISKLAPKEQPSVEVIIVSGDLDTLQLVDKYTKVYTMRKGLAETTLYDEEAVRKRFGGLGPEQMVDYKGLKGDPSDNIPGVPGVGEKTAIQLLCDFGSLDVLYKKLEQGTDVAKIKPKLAQKLRDNKEQALFSRELATIYKDVPIKFRLEDLTWKDFDRAAAEKLLRGFEFSSLIRRMPAAAIPRSPDLFLRSPKVAEGQRKGALREKGLVPPKVRGGEGETPEITNLQGAVAKQSAEQSDFLYEKIETLYRDGIFSKEIYEMEKKLAPVIRAMREAGIKIDTKHFSKLAKKITAQLKDAEQKIYQVAEKKFNINSPQQLSVVLFEDLGLPTKGLKKTPGRVISTAVSELEKLEGKHAIISELFIYRELQKLYSTYIRPLPEIADERDRIHSSFDQLGTATGRVSSSSPNMQNIPIRGEWGRKIRRGFIAEKGYKLVSFDYSQMELRIAAHMANDERMREFFRQGEDIHRMTAAEVFGIARESVTKEMRFRAKALNFGVLYGMGATGFAKSAGIAREEAQDFIDNYFARFPAIRQFIDRTKELARKQGYVETLLGRKRYIPEIESTSPGLRAQAERMAINHPIQGTAADIIKMAMVAVADQGLLTENCKLLLQIHDELLFEMQDDIIETTSQVIKKIMEDSCALSVPVRVDVSCGPSWGELDK